MAVGGRAWWGGHSWPRHPTLYGAARGYDRVPPDLAFDAQCYVAALFRVVPIHATRLSAYAGGLTAVRGLIVVGDAGRNFDARSNRAAAVRGVDVGADAGSATEAKEQT
jgi:hypothetical protein